MDESRKQFYEAFEVLTGWEVNDYPNSDVVRLCHQMWDMSRAAIEIELPKKIEHQPFDTDFENGFCGGHNNAIDSATIRIRAAGIKVKE